MTPSRPLSAGLDVPQESSAVAYVAEAPQADVICLGAIGTRQRDLDLRIRKRRSQSHHSAYV